jgi:hypothetical protein
MRWEEHVACGGTREVYIGFWWADLMEKRALGWDIDM